MCVQLSSIPAILSRTQPVWECWHWSPLTSSSLAAGMFLLFLVSPCPTCTMVPWTDAAQENGVQLCSAFLRFFFLHSNVFDAFPAPSYMPESTSPLMCPGLKSIFDFRQKKKKTLRI
ncbi:hypothetical protein Pelo_14038 [Pelomyxa schiedti]|nr:hypothetical protein Pelo_14038 [Pelomyxa schiedti]